MNTISNFDRNELFNFYRSKNYSIERINKFLDLITEISNCKVIEGVRIVFSDNIDFIYGNPFLPFTTIKFFKSNVNLELPESEYSKDDYEPTIFLDYNTASMILTQLSKIRNDVLMGTIYHELGHIKNNHFEHDIDDRQLEEEIAADNYVVEHGYGEAFLSFLYTAKYEWGWEMEKSDEDFNRRVANLKAKINAQVKK